MGWLEDKGGLGYKEEAGLNSVSMLSTCKMIDSKGEPYRIEQLV